MPKEHIVRPKLTSCECRMCCDSMYVGSFERNEALCANEEDEIASNANNEFEITKGVNKTFMHSISVQEGNFSLEFINSYIQDQLLWCISRTSDWDFFAKKEFISKLPSNFLSKEDGKIVLSVGEGCVVRFPGRDGSLANSLGLHSCMEYLCGKYYLNKILSK